MKALKWIPMIAVVMASTAMAPAPEKHKDGDDAVGISFFQGSFEEAKAQAKLENKLIFIDAYARWCGPCKMMSRKVFPKAEVGDFYNTNFINLKVDTEKGEGPDLSRKYGIRYLPTLLFVDAEGNEVKRLVGYHTEQQLLKEGKSLATNS